MAVTAILNGFKWTPAHQTRLDDAWKNLLIAEHHDSVAAGIYKEGRDFTDPSMTLSQDLAREAAEFVATRTRVKGDAVFVFNPTGHSRSEAVFLRTAGPVRVIAPDGTTVAGQEGPTGACFAARDVPALGYKVYRIELGVSAERSEVLECGRLRPLCIPPATRESESGVKPPHSKLTDLRPKHWRLRLTDTRWLSVPRAASSSCTTS